MARIMTKNQIFDHFVPIDPPRVQGSPQIYIINFVHNYENKPNRGKEHLDLDQLYKATVD